MIRTITAAILVFGALAACQNPPTQNNANISPPGLNETEKVDHPIMMSEKAHHKSTFMDKGMVAYDLVLTFGGKERFRGRIWQTTEGSRIRLEEEGGRILVYKDAEVRMQPMEAKSAGARFDVLTWPYFFAFPYKLSDPGTFWGEFASKRLMDKQWLSGRLSFASGTGDSPDDWYQTYFDPETHQVKAAAYIVTFGQSAEAASEDPHAVVYEDYQEVDGVPIAHRWLFYGWREKEGLTDQLGEAFVSNVEFAAVNEDKFVLRENFQVISNKFSIPKVGF
ncbi:MAG: hypothetical protein ACFB10_07070 [Salibacteraceae bacterium]